MLSESRKITRPELLKMLPPLERPVTVRLKFVKVGNLQYISHLDLQRTFNRVLVRSGLPVWYTKGFNPHAKLVFSTPLSVGTQSVCEFLDLRLDREMSCEDVKNMLNAELTDEMYVTEVYFPESKFADIAFCEYEYEIFTEGASAELAEKISALFTASPLNMVKKTKSGEREIDIIPLIKSISAGYDADGGVIRIRAILSAATESFLNPEMLMTAMKEKLSVMTGDPAVEWYTIMRTRSLKADMSEFR